MNPELNRGRMKVNKIMKPIKYIINNKKDNCSASVRVLFRTG